MRKSTAVILTVAVLALVGIGVFALAPIGRNYNDGGTFPGSPRAGGPSNGGTGSQTAVPRNETTNVFNSYFSTTTIPRQEGARYFVTYNEDGFSPQSLVITRGDSVTFINNSTSTIRISDLPGIDALATVEPSSSWTYVFWATGTYNYHNRFDSADTGSVIVR